MNRKIFFVLAFATSLICGLFVGIAASYRGENVTYVPYRFEAVLSDAVTTMTMNPPIISIDGYRPASGLRSANLTINKVVYTYPEDFSYNETFQVEHNQNTGRGVLVVTTVFTFNLPGNPTLTEYMTTSATRNGTTTTWGEGVLYLTGSGQFGHVSGGGFIESTQEGGVDYAWHIGLIKGWPF